jgi:16S rRNA (adenine(1408)-N(1))-methyltransferase
LLAAARRSPDTLFVGLDTNIAALKAAARAASRKPYRGGAPNAAFVAGSALELPGPFAGAVDAISVLLPWGSLLRAALSTDGLRAMRQAARPGASFEAVVSYDATRDAAKWGRLGVSATALECGAMERTLALAGWRNPCCREMRRAELAAVGTTWAKKIAGSPGRRAWRLTAVAE